MIAIVDYGAGNIRSVLNALKRSLDSARDDRCDSGRDDRCDCARDDDVVLTSDKDLLRKASHVILPGVGEASTAMQALRDAGLADFIPTLTQPVLGICVGAQLMCAGSEEGDVRCMGIFPAEVRRFKETPAEKVPHMGWNSLRELSSPLFAGLKHGEYVYFVHSYYPEVCDNTIAICNHGIDFSAALCRDNFFACQFHPEKSGAAGERILKNFLAL